MHRVPRAFLPLALLTIAAAPVTTGLTIGSQPFAQSDIIDARTVFGADGMPAILVTFAPKAAQRVAALTAANIGKPLVIEVDGHVLTAPLVREAITGGAIEISGVGSVGEATALAHRISGKDPVPESLEE